jgi:hypothetical protein
MHFTKALFVAFAAVAATVSAAPSEVEKRQSADCDRAVATIGEARSIAATAGSGLTGSAQVRVNSGREALCISSIMDSSDAPLAGGASAGTL